MIEMNPRVSRSSALASKATGFPIAKIAAKLACGYTLDEIKNDITKETYASFEPTIDYCVVKVPRWTFEKFPETDDLLTTSMKSVGETMAIGRTFKEALQKAVRSLEIGRFGLGELDPAPSAEHKKQIVSLITTPNSKRLFALAEAMRMGFDLESLNRMSRIDPWFLNQIKQIVDAEVELRESGPEKELLKEAKKLGFADKRLAELWGKSEDEIRFWRYAENIVPVYKLVDTCAAEFEAYTPYYYSTYEDEDESRPSEKPRVVILGGGPNRIGQGIEFDYCCVHASFALKDMGYESIMVNSNPETVSTDYDISDKLFFEPLTLEDVLHIIRSEKPLGVIVQFGGQTPLNLAKGLAAAGVKILGTSPDAIDRAEDRERFQEIVDKLKLKQPQSAIAFNTQKAVEIAERIGYPVLVRPSYVLGGRSMEIIYDTPTLSEFMVRVLEAFPDNAILIDKFLEDAIEVDVDAISDGTMTVIGGIMEHIEEAGIHSGDSACVLPPVTLAPDLIRTLQEQACMIAAELNVVGLMNIQFAIKDGQVYVLEVNPRASRTIPFVSKAIGKPLAQLATKVMLGSSLAELGFTDQIWPQHISVKESVFPFSRFPNINVVLGPEMRSTGEVMGLDLSFATAYAKAQMATGFQLPLAGTVFISVHDRHKDRIVALARRFAELGFSIMATKGTAACLKNGGLEALAVAKVSEGRPNIVDRIKNGEVQLIINTSIGRRPSLDAYHIRQSAIRYNIPYTTTLEASHATAEAIKALQNNQWDVAALQDFFH